MGRSEKPETVAEFFRSMFEPIKTTRVAHKGRLLEHGVPVSIDNLDLRGSVVHASASEAKTPGSYTTERTTTRRTKFAPNVRPVASRPHHR